LGRSPAVEPIAREGAGDAPRGPRVRLRERRQRAIAAGLAGALLAFLTLTAVQALGVAPYLPPDELYHVSYAVSYAVVVGEGHLPTLTTPVPTGEIPLPPRDGRPRRIYTANHPPLFHLPESVVLRIGSPTVALLAARLLSACFGAAGVLLVAWLALVLVPGRPRVAVAAAWFVALLPLVPHYSAFVYNDGLGFLASTAALVAGALALRRGPNGWRLLGLSAAAAAAALTRAPGLALIAVAGAVAAVAVWLHLERPAGRCLLLAAGTGALVGGTSLASSIWFYLRNRALYGQLTGSRYNQALFGFPAQDHPVRLAASPGYLLRLFDGLWGWTRFPTRQIPVQRSLVLLPRLLALAVLAGLVVATVRGLRRRRGRPEGASSPARAAPLGEVASWLLLAGWLLLAFLMVAWYDGNGGHTHARYLLPAIGVVAVVEADGRAALPGARRELTTLAASVALLALTGFAWSRFVAAVARAGATPGPTPRALAELLRQHGVGQPWPLLIGASLLLLAALALQQGGLWLLAGERPSDLEASSAGRPAPAHGEIRPR
jgi:4-amino-4-deoxy-L-arabinose transferase-like glycosyltransferase